MDVEDILEGLNHEQKIAVKTIDGPLLIQAGAGSGKTKTLTHRIAYLIATGQAQPNEILAVTFTNKAAGEMRQRLAKILGADNSRSFMPWMGTFHSTAVRLLRYYGDVIEIPDNFVIFDETDKLSLIKSIMRDLKKDEKQFNPRAIASMISTAKNSCLSAQDYILQYNKRPIQQLTGEVYSRYQRRLRDNSALDFDDLLVDVIEMLTRSENVRQKLKQRFRYVLIDEYQDTNQAQYRIIKLLLNDDNNICAVGDDWQSIYSWRGADFTNILNFERDFPGTTVIKLERNYRSTEEILSAAHNIIIKNKRRSEKKLWTDNRGGEPIKLLVGKNEFNEADLVVQQINQEVSAGVRNYRDFAVLYRTNVQSRVFEQVLMRNNIPYKIIGGLRFYDRAEIKDILAYLKVLYQPHDSVSLRRIINVPRRGLGDVTVGRFMDWVRETDYDLVTALTKAKECPDLSRLAEIRLIELGETLRQIAERLEVDTPEEIIKQVLSKVNYKSYIDDGTDQGESRLQNIGELISMAKDYPDLASFLEEVSLISSSDATNEDNAITLMTLHAAKGLEFPVVFMVGLEDGLFPSVNSSRDKDDIEEERRLCYVGMTRAREELFMTYANKRTVFGSIRFNVPSPFIDDLELTTKEITKKPNCYKF